MYCPKEISSARYYEPQSYKEFYTEETDGISLLFPGLNTAGLSKANIPPPVDNNIVSTHEFSSPRAANNFLAGGGQIVSSNLFLLGHNYPIFGRTNIDNNNNEPSNIQLKLDTLNFVLTSVNDRTNCPAIY